MTCTLTIGGLGPGDAALVTPEVSAALAGATDVLGYAPYVARVPARDGLTLHPSDNRMELQRAGEALRLAADGRNVVIVSSGDPGVFAMAAAVFEALEAAPQWQDVSIRVLPGVTAMLAAAARAGAPLGHDFCAINLSDNLKPWPTIEKRLRLAAEADFAIALYNPRSKSRPEGFARALDVLKEAGCGERTIIFAHAVTTPRERIDILPLREARAGAAGVSRDNPCDVSYAHQLEIVLEGEGAARDDEFGVRQRQWALGRIDESQRIGVLRLGGKGRKMLPADRQEYAGARLRQGVDRGVDVFDLDPSVALNARPGRALQREQRDFRRRAGCGRVAAHLGGKRMGRIDDMRDSFGPDERDQAGHATKTAGAYRQQLSDGALRPPGVGIDGIDPGTHDRAGELVGVAGSAQNEGAHHG